MAKTKPDRIPTRVVQVQPSMLTLAVLFLATMLMTGCVTTRRGYDGPKRPKAETAMLDPKITKVPGDSSLSEVERAQILRIDDKVVGSKLMGYPDYVEVLPGEHVVVADYFTTRKVGVAQGGAIPFLVDRMVNADIATDTIRTLRFTAEAGKTYFLWTQTDEGKGHNLRMWIEDATTTQIVSTDVEQVDP